MAASFAAEFRRLLRAPAEERAERAAGLLQRDEDWSVWAEAFNAAHVRVPEQEAVAAAVLATAAGRRRRSTLAARFRLLEGRALQRSGSPARAVRALRRAGRDLRRLGEDERAAGADILCVDALAVAGRLDEALALADETGRRLGGARAPMWRAVLAINRGNALRLRGDLTEAVAVYDAAARTLNRLGDAHTATIARTNAGTALMDAGDATAAARRFEAAAAFFDGAGQEDMAAETRANLAAALVRAGRLGEGIRELERLVRDLRRRGLKRREALGRMDLADALLRAGDTTASERQAVEAARIFARVGARAERVEALWVAAAAAPSAAAGHLRRALDAARRADRPAYELRCELLGADLALRAGREVPRTSLAGILRRARALGQAEIAGQARLLSGYRALSRERPRDAVTHFSAPSLRGTGRPWLRAAADAGRAIADARLGRRADALRRLRRTCAFLDTVRADLPGAWLRTTFLLDRLDPYLAQVDLLLARGREPDRREAASVLDGLALRRFLGSRPPRAPKTLARERLRLEAIYDRLARGEGPTRGLDARLSADLEREARRLERRFAHEWRRVERTAKERGPGAPGRSSPALRGTVVHVWERGGRVFGLVSTRDATEPRVDLGSVAQLKASLGMLAFHDDRARRSTRAGPAVTRSLAAIADTVLTPLGAHGWRGAVDLVLDPRVPDLPWEMLPLDRRPLSRRCELLRVPASAARSGRRTRGRGTTVIALGEASLPGSRRESGLLARRGRVVHGAEATREAVAESLRSRRLVHLTGHGFDAPEAPGLGGVRVADGWFGAADVPDHLAAEVVVLAACRTGRVRGPAGLAWGGLPSALLAAGASSVLWTAADVDDRTTADLMEHFHRALPRTSAPAALGRALEAVATRQGHAAGLLDFRLSGFPR